MKLIVHRGTHEIGGTCIEVATENTRIILDFGMPLTDDSGKDYDENKLKNKSIDQLVKEKILPPVDGLYENQTPKIDAVFITHSHKDHYGLIKYINPAIPVYMSSGAKKLIEVLNPFINTNDTIDTSKFNEVYHLKSMLKGDFVIKPYYNDHSGFAAMSFLIKDKITNKYLFYTGDFRETGYRNKYLDLILKSPPSKIDCLITEGTMIGRENNNYPDEESVYKRTTEILSTTKNKVVFAFCSSQNIDRIISFYRAVKEKKSLLIVDPYTACVLYALKDESKFIPQYFWPKVKVLFANDGKGDKFIWKMFNSELSPLINEFDKKKVKPQDIQKQNSNMLLLMRNSIIPAVEQIRGINGSKVVYSQWAGYLKKENKSSETFREFVKKYNLDYEHVHTSGHATVDVLKKFADAVNPKTIIPVHTEKPEKFKDVFVGHKVVELNDGDEYIV